MKRNQKWHKPLFILFTGLPASGKTTLASAVANMLEDCEYRTCAIDADVMRRGLCSDLGYSQLDRKENLRRLGEVGRLLTEAGLIVLASYIAPFKRDREALRQNFGEIGYLEIYLSTPLTVCEARDPKGLYSRARKGSLVDFTGLDSPYEVPEQPDMTLDTSVVNIDDCARKVVDLVKSTAALRPVGLPT